MAENNPFAAFLLSPNGPDALAKAKMASALAKLADGPARAALYTQKNFLLCAAIATAPHQFVLTYYDERGLIGVRHTLTGEGFHIPIGELTVAAREALAGQLARFLSPAEAA